MLAATWTTLQRAVVDAKHEWHLPIVATAVADGSPQARTVVLRGIDPHANAGPGLRFHTDDRSGKVAEIRRDARVGVLFYDRAAKVQLRLKGHARVHQSDEIADAAWRASPPSSRRCYLAPHPPSARLDAWHPNLPDAWTNAVPPAAEPEVGRANFAVVIVTIAAMDRLELHHDGHIRSRWRWQGPDLIESAWLAP